MLHIDFKNSMCHVEFPSSRKVPCRISILRNGNVAVSNLGVKSPTYGETDPPPVGPSTLELDTATWIFQN